MIDRRRWPKPDARLDVDAALVGTAMVLRLVHPREHVAIDLAPAARIENAGDSAHAQSLPVVQPRRRLGCAIAGRAARDGEQPFVERA